MINLAKKFKPSTSPGNEDNNNKGATGVTSLSRLNSSKKALIRDKLLLKEIQEIESNLPQNCKLVFPNANELHKIELTIQPTESFWAGGKFLFAIDVPEDYNFVPPKVKCKTRIWHPNINEEGDICLSILRENSFDGLGWAPTRTLKDVVWGLDSLFTDLLNFDDALNEKAAQHYMNDKIAFKNKVKEYILKYAR